METWKWITGTIVLPLIGILVTYVLTNRKNHKDTHKDIYNKLDNLEKLKADETMVKEEINKLTSSMDCKIEGHVRETQTSYQMLFEAYTQHSKLTGERISSMDSKLDTIISKLIPDGNIPKS